MLKHYTEKYPRTWSQLLPSITFSYNTSRHESTGKSLYEVVYGQTASLPIDTIILPPSVDQDNLRRLQDLQEVRKSIPEILRAAQQRQKKYYDLTRQPHYEFKKDQLVMIRVNRPARQEEYTKFLPRWEGPYKVLAKVNDHTYKILVRRYGRMMPDDIHVAHMKTYIG